MAKGSLTEDLIGQRGTDRLPQSAFNWFRDILGQSLEDSFASPAGENRKQREHDAAQKEADRFLESEKAKEWTKRAIAASDAKKTETERKRKLDEFERGTEQDQILNRRKAAVDAGIKEGEPYLKSLDEKLAASVETPDAVTGDFPRTPTSQGQESLLPIESFGGLGGGIGGPGPKATSQGPPTESRTAYPQVDPAILKQVEAALAGPAPIEPTKDIRTRLTSASPAATSQFQGGTPRDALLANNPIAAAMEPQRPLASMMQSSLQVPMESLGFNTMESQANFNAVQKKIPNIKELMLDPDIARDVVAAVLAIGSTQGDHVVTLDDVIKILKEELAEPRQ